MFERKNWARHSKKILTERSFILADPVLDMMIEPGDPIGKYRIEATVHDHVSGKSAVGSWDIDIER
jgi:hypothetical protein